MYLGVALVAAIILVVASPLIWIAWWILADLSQAATASPAVNSRGVAMRRRLPAS